MAALGARHALAERGVPYVCFDKAPYIGGHTASFAHPGGFIFDDGPHVSFTKDEGIRELFAATVEGRFESVAAHVNNYWHGRWVTHPAQVNLHSLPPDLVTKVILDFVAIHEAPVGEIRNYADWLVAAYGRTFAETFPMVYGRKYHTTSADNMTTDWLGPRMYRPSLEEVIRGALAAPDTNVHYVTSFRYPTNGGFVSYLRPFETDRAVRLEHDLVELEPRSRELRFANGARATYESLVSSIPLPDLVPRIARAPADVVAAAERLS
ncbi:MAG TPA: NAD(P)-binding protein, partial [Candidatus Limnocylindrales bacterium]